MVDDKLVQIVGEGNVNNNQDILQEYSRDMSFVTPLRPDYVVKVRNTQEVQQVVKWAGDTGRPLVPVSSGPPRFHGDTVPTTEGAVIVDLSEMKKVIKVDRRNRVAMIEPGVTFAEFIPELEKEGMTAYMPLMPRISKSVLTSYLEREPITVPRDHWETQDPLLCTEIIYGSGDLFRTGSAAGPGTLEEQWAVGRAQVRGLGPTQIDFAKLSQAAQGTLGIVTWATVKCKLLPKRSKTFLIPADSVDCLIDFAYRLLWKRLGNTFVILNAHNLACILAQDEKDIKRLRDSLPSWVFILSIDGAGLMPEERVAYQQAEFMKEAQKHGLEPSSIIPGTSSDEVARALSRPSPDPYWKLRYSGGCHDIFFLTTMDRTPQFIAKAYELVQASRYPTEEVGVYLQPTVQGTNCHCEFNLSYAPQNTREIEQVKALDIQASQSLANMGGFFSRPYGSWASIAYSRDSATVAALRKVKNIFDPKSIMNPGKLCF